MSPWKPERHLLGNLYIITLGTLRTFTWKTWEPWGNLYNTTLGTLTTFTWETWESWGNLYNATLESLRKPWQYNLGTLENLYNVTLGTLREPLQCNLGKLEETLTILPWNPWEPLQCNLGNLEGTFTIQPWEPWKTWEPSGNLEETFKKPSGNLEETLREPWQSNLGIPWESYRNLYNVTLGTWTTFTWEPLHNNLGNLDNLYLENLGTLQGTLKEPWGTWGNLLGTFLEPWGNLEEPWEPLNGNLYLEPGNLGGMGFGAAPVCSETFTMAEDPKAFCCWGKTCSSSFPPKKYSHPPYSSHLHSKISKASCHFCPFW